MRLYWPSAERPGSQPQDEKQALWPRPVELYPGWDAHRHCTDRSFRAFLLEPAGD